MTAEHARTYVMPVYSPLYRLPPFEYLHIRRLSVLFETDIANIKAITPPPLEPAGNQVVVWLENRVAQRGQLVDARGDVPITSSFEASVDIPVRYKNEMGITWAFMYVPPTPGDGDARMAVGRELQGAPKKQAYISLREELLEERVVGTCTRLGVDIISMTAKLTGRNVQLPDLSRVLTVKTFPRIDGSGPDLEKVVTLVWGREILMSKGGDVEHFEFGRSEADPLYRLRPTSIIGAVFEVYKGDVHEGEDRR